MSSSRTRSARSNRAQGDYFELLVARDLAGNLEATGQQVRFDYTEELLELRQRIVAIHGAGAAARINQQERNAAQVAGPVLELTLDRSRDVGPVRKVRWTGRATGLDVGVADLIVEHAAGATALTLKSTKSGRGTARNLGGRALADLLGVDVSCLNEPMYEQTLAAWKQQVPAERHASLAAMTLEGRKTSASETERAVAGQVGTEAMTLICDAIMDAFATLPQARLRAAAAAATGTNSQTNLFAVIANNTGAVVEEVPEDAPAGTFTATRITPVRIEVRCNNEPLFHWQANCTNGKGLSPLCLRSFTAA